MTDPFYVAHKIIPELNLKKPFWALGTSQMQLCSHLRDFYEDNNLIYSTKCVWQALSWSHGGLIVVPGTDYTERKISMGSAVTPHRGKEGRAKKGRQSCPVLGHLSAVWVWLCSSHLFPLFIVVGSMLSQTLVWMTEPICPSICREPERDLSSWESRVPEQVAQTARINTGFE